MLAEDALQDALVNALERWELDGTAPWAAARRAASAATTWARPTARHCCGSGSTSPTRSRRTRAAARALPG